MLFGGVRLYGLSALSVFSIYPKLSSNLPEPPNFKIKNLKPKPQAPSPKPQAPSPKTQALNTPPQFVPQRAQLLSRVLLSG